MRVLIIDQECLGLDFAIRASDADHEVRWYRYMKKPVKDGEGFKQFTLVDDWKPHMKWAKDGLIIMTGNSRFLADIDRYRDMGYKIFGPTAKSAKLELERAAGLAVLEKAGIDVPSYKTFDSLQSALNFARKADMPYVFKPMGDEEDKSLTYVADDVADLVGWIERQIARGAKMKGQCMLQEKIEMVSELGVSGWFGPEGFLPAKWQVCFEHKKLMAGENGPNTGEQGSVCHYVDCDDLASQFLEPLAVVIQRTGHRGDFAVGAGIDKSGKAWPFEFTARLGWPAFYLQIASHKGDPCQWMRDLLDGKDTLKVSYDVSIGVVCTQPPYPYENLPPEVSKRWEGNPIAGLDPVYDDIHCAAVQVGKGPVMKGRKIAEEKIYKTSGPYVLTATATGKTVSKARDKVYRTIDQIGFPDMMYRNDIGLKLEEPLPKLQKFGYAKGMAFA